MKHSSPTILALLIASVAAPCQGDQWRTLDCDRSAVLGALSCGATACHGGGELSRRTSGGELERWRSADPHANAGGLIEGKAFADILQKNKTFKATLHC